MSREERLDSLLGAYALDALDPDERLEVEQYLERSPEARAEIRRLSVAVDALAISTAGEPDTDPNDQAFTTGWARIQTGLTSTGDDGERELPLLRLEPPRSSAEPPAPVVSLASRRSRRFLPLLAAAAALLLGLAGGAVLTRDSGGGRTDAAESALDNPASRTGVLNGAAASDPSVKVAIDPSGQGYLFADTLPALPTDRTYQLWSVNGDSVISLAVLGPDPSVVTFPAGTDVTTLAITAEEAPGVAVSTQPAVASGTLA
jgi:anti-sigma factor RsiW